MLFFHHTKSSYVTGDKSPVCSLLIVFLGAAFPFSNFEIIDTFCHLRQLSFATGRPWTLMITDAALVSKCYRPGFFQYVKFIVA